MTINGIDLSKLLKALEYCDTGSCCDCVYYYECASNDCQSQMHMNAHEVIKTLSEMALKESVLKNCVNCSHKVVCAGIPTDYTACTHWEPKKG